MAFAFDPDPSQSDTPAGDCGSPFPSESNPRDPRETTRIAEKSAIWESIKQLGYNQKGGGFFVFERFLKKD